MSQQISHRSTSSIHSTLVTFSLVKLEMCVCWPCVVCNLPAATVVRAVHGTCGCLRTPLNYHVVSDNLAIRVTDTHCRVLGTEAVCNRGLALPKLRWRP
jgi:hypothetical protein